ncbi:hypothetical protein P692DRAFT_201810652 [Suillus brevipes Sb2]|nr:hypothetical protein P692DRAFT_201810652 [Suillus brevipes Sb2]
MAFGNNIVANIKYKRSVIARGAAFSVKRAEEIGYRIAREDVARAAQKARARARIKRALAKGARRDIARSAQTEPSSGSERGHKRGAKSKEKKLTSGGAPCEDSHDHPMSLAVA